MSTQLYYHPSDRFPYRPISSLWLIGYICLSFNFFYQFIRRIATKFNTNHWIRHNILLSFVHASMCSILLIVALLRAPEIFDDPLSHSNHFNNALIAFSIGYFLCDLLDCLQNASIFSIWGILIHHLIVILFFTQVLLSGRNIGYALYGLSLEINSVFLHARRLLRWHLLSFKSSSWQNRLEIFVDLGNYITFILFRFGMVIVGIRALYIQRDRLDPRVYLLNLLIAFAVGILNIVLFYRLMKTRSARMKQDTDH